MFRNFLTAVSVLLALAIVGSSPASGEETLGSWCFKPDPDNRIYNQIITIEATNYGTIEAPDFGTPMARIETMFGFAETFFLNKISEDIFEVSDGLNQEGYRLISDGSLEFFNMYGTVGVAIRIPEGQDKQDCFN